MYSRCIVDILTDHQAIIMIIIFDIVFFSLVNISVLMKLTGLSQVGVMLSLSGWSWIFFSYNPTRIKDGSFL